MGPRILSPSARARARHYLRCSPTQAPPGRAEATRTISRPSLLAEKNATSKARGGPASAEEREHLALGGLRGRLAARAVVALAELVRVESDVDRRPALVTRKPATLLHRTQLPAIEHKARAPRPTVAIAPQQLACGEDDPAQLAVIELADLRPGPCAGDEERLILDLVPDARQGALVEERGGDVALGLRTKAAQAFLEIEVVGDHIRAELGYHRVKGYLADGHKLDDGRRLARRNVLVGADDDARLRRREPPALPRTVDMPLPLHPHMRVKDDVLAIGGKRDQEVLAVRLDGLDRAADHLATRGGRRDFRRDELEARHDSPGKRASEHGRGAEDRVAFGHRAIRRARRAGDNRVASARSRPRAARP